MEKKLSLEIENLIAYIVSATESYRYIDGDDAQIIDEREYDKVVKAVDELSSLTVKSDDKDLLEFVKVAKEFASNIKLVPKKFYAIPQEKAESYDKKLRDLTNKYNLQ
ncbi:MAG: hypothetical protein ACOX4W_06460 [Bacilli bacterium]|jgi:hypothetical protein